MPCLICERDDAQAQEINGRFRVRCRRCGEFTISREAADDWRQGIWPNLNPRQRVNASGWIRERRGIFVRSELLEFLRNIPTPTVSERADKLLAEMERRSETPGVSIGIHLTEAFAVDYAGAAWAVDQNELQYLAKRVLGERNLVYVAPSSPGVYAMAPDGYTYLEKLRRVNTESDIGFAAMWFDQEVGQLWAQGLEPAIKEARFRPVRIDQHEHNNRIDDEIIAMIRKSRFVVADYTGSRGGVYFEAGFAMGLGLPVIWTCREDWMDKLHFDVRQFSFLVWTAEGNGLADLRGKLKNRIEATIGKGGYVAQQ